MSGQQPAQMPVRACIGLGGNLGDPLQALRAAGVSAQMHAGTGEGMGSMKSQFKKADGSGAAFGLIFGADELARGEVTVKALRDGQGAQRCERLDAVAQWATSLQSS